MISSISDIMSWFVYNKRSMNTMTTLTAVLLVGLPLLFIGGWYGNQFANPSQVITEYVDRNIYVNTTISQNMNISLNFDPAFSLQKFVVGYDQLSNMNFDQTSELGDLFMNYWQSFEIGADFNATRVELDLILPNISEIANISLWNSTIISSKLVPDQMLISHSGNFDYLKFPSGLNLYLDETSNNTYFIGLILTDGSTIFGNDAEADTIAYTNDTGIYTESEFHLDYLIEGEYLSSDWIQMFEDADPMLLYLKMGLKLENTITNNLSFQKDLTIGMMNLTQFGGSGIPTPLNRNLTYTTMIESTQDLAFGGFMEYICFKNLFSNPQGSSPEGALAINWGFLMLSQMGGDFALDEVLSGFPQTNGSVLLTTNANHNIMFKAINIYRNMTLNDDIPFISCHLIMDIDNVEYDFVLNSFDLFAFSK